MKRLFTSLPGLAVLAVLCLASTANAAVVGSLSCTANSGDFKFNVSYFTFGVTQTINLGGTGTGGGKATFQPLDVHAALSTFATLIRTATVGSEILTCTLSTPSSEGSLTSFEFKPLIIKALTAVAEKTGTSNTPAQYTDVQFAYGAVAVKTTGGADDGGTTPEPSNLSRITNGSDTGAPGPD